MSVREKKRGGGDLLLLERVDHRGLAHLRGRKGKQKFESGGGWEGFILCGGLAQLWEGG